MRMSLQYMLDTEKERGQTALFKCYDFGGVLPKGSRGIVFTHGVRKGGPPGGRREKVYPGCISETVRCIASKYLIV